jgi:DNA-binding NarL/FixJ family response regulator
MRLLLADDHATIRQGLIALFKRDERIEVVGEASNGDEAVALAKELRPDVIIVDIAMPCLNGIEVIRQINDWDPRIKLIVLSMHGDHHIVIDALKAGCHAYVLKSAAYEEMTIALEAVMQGERYMSPPITGVVVNEVVDPTPSGIKGGLRALTPRERQVLQLTSEGATVKEIAHALHLSPKTIDAERRHIMQKTGEDSIAGLTKLAISEGLTSVEF